MKRRKIRRKMSEKRLLKLKRQLRKRAKKLRLGKKRTGAYVYGTLRRVRGNQMRSSFDKPVFGPGNVETRIVRTDTLTGIKEAERLVRDGWYQGRVGLFTTTYYRKRRATPQVAPSWKTGIYTGRGIVKNPDEYARQIPRESRPMKGRGFSGKFDTSAGSTHADLANFIAGLS